MPGVKLKWLKIHQYRNVRPGTELRFDDGVNLVLGQNGSGKTTLLGLLACVTSRSLASLEREAFDLEYMLSDGDASAMLRVRNVLLKVTDARDGRLDAHYQAALSQRADGRTCTIDGDPTKTEIATAGVTATLPPISPFKRDFLDDSILRLKDPPLWLGKLTNELFLDSVVRFDESLDAFLTMTGRPPVSQSAGSPASAFLHLTKFTNVPASPRSRNFTPFGLGQLVPRAHERPGGAFTISTAEDSTNEPDLAFLTNATRLLGLPVASWEPLIVRTEAPPNGNMTRYEVQGSAFTFTRHDGTTITHDLLSYGQKRLLAYFYYLAATPAYVIADELVNGLHHRWIAACMEAIGERQAFLTSQNPLLFEYVEFDSIEQVEHRFLTCKSELVDGAEQLVWQNMPRDDAERFYRGYQADIESIGDILINRGLW